MGDQPLARTRRILLFLGASLVIICAQPAAGGSAPVRYPEAAVKALEEYADAAMEAGDRRRAVEFLDHASEILRAGKFDKDFAFALRVADLYLRGREHEKVLGLLEPIDARLRLAESGLLGGEGSIPQLPATTTLLLLSDVFVMQSNFAAAELTLRRAVKWAQTNAYLRHEALQKMHSIQLAGGDQRAAANTLDQMLTAKIELALELHGARRTDDAVGLLQQVILTAEGSFGAASNLTVHAVIVLAKLQLEARSPAESRRLLENHLQKVKSTEGSASLIVHRLENQLAYVLVNLHELYAAEDVATRAVEGLERELGAQDPETVASKVVLGLVLKQRNRYDKAEEVYLEALSQTRSIYGPRASQTLVLQDNLVALFRDSGQYDRAIELARETTGLFGIVMGDGHIDTIAAQMNFGRLLHSTGKFKPALETMKNAVKKSVEVVGSENFLTLQFRTMLAQLYSDRGEYEDAEHLLKDVVSLASEQEHAITAVVANLRLLELLVLQGRFEDVEDIIDTVTLEAYAAGVFAEADRMRTRYLLAIEDFKRAEEFLSRSRRLLGQPPSHPIMLENARGLGAALLGLGRLDEAYALAESSMSLHIEVFGEEHPSTVLARCLLAKIAGALKTSDADAVSLQAYDASVAVLGSSHPTTLGALETRVTIATDRGNLAEAFELLRLHLSDSTTYLHTVLWGASESTRASILRQQFETGNQLLRLAMRTHRGGPEAALTYSIARKGLLLDIASKTAAIAKATKDPVTEGIATELGQARRALASISRIEPDRATLLKMSGLRATVEELERRLGRQVSSVARAFDRSTIADIKSAMSENQGLVDFLVYVDNDEPHLLAVCIDSVAARPMRLIDLGLFAPIREAVLDFRESLISLSDNEIEASKALYRLIWQPITGVLGSKEEIFVVPDDMLHLVPFNALQNGSGQHLLDRHTIAVIDSPRRIAERTPLHRGAPDISNALVFAAPLYAPQQKASYERSRPATLSSVTVSSRKSELYFGPLPGALEEGRDIAEQLSVSGKFQVTRFFLEDASEFNLANIASPSILHLATHGFFLGGEESRIGDALVSESIQHPLLASGLALANANDALASGEEKEYDGILTALEVLALDLENTELVVLSACETGVGYVNTGDGVYGLHRAFTEAGAGAVLYTLWEVSDDATMIFMSEFYHHVLAGLAPKQALVEAQLKLRSNETWDHPFFWSPFVISGGLSEASP